MAVVTTKVIKGFLKNGKTVILEDNEWEFCDDLWSIIKEFAGIYRFNIKWDKVLLKNQSHLLQVFIRFTNDSNKELPASHFKKSEDVVRKQFWQKVNKAEFKDVYSAYTSNTGIEKFNKKHILERLFDAVGVWTLPEEFQVGDEIQFYTGHYGDRSQRAGIIISIANNRESYKIKEYCYCNKRIDDDTNPYETYYTWDWDKENTKTSTIRCDKGIRKGLTNPTHTTYWY